VRRRDRDPSVSPADRRRGSGSGRWCHVVSTIAALVIGAASVVVAGGCSDSSRPLPVVEDIPAAIGAVDAASPTPQAFREVNADVGAVRMFVASDPATEVTGYLYTDGELLGPAPPQRVDPGLAFTADAVAFDADSVFSAVLAELDDPIIERFVITATDDGGVRYEVFVRSERGGLLAVQVSGDGRVLGVVPR
jgi:hypothetical protein